MASPQATAPSSAPYGVQHSNVRHTTRFTVIGNHLVQHPKLTLTARGLGAYIQSLPPGTPIGIKDLVRWVPEGATRIATALRELEDHGYLKRTVEQLPSGQFVTRTVSYNHPTAMTRPTPVPPPAPDPEPVPTRCWLRYRCRCRKPRCPIRSPTRSRSRKPYENPTRSPSRAPPRSPTRGPPPSRPRPAAWWP